MAARKPDAVLSPKGGFLPNIGGTVQTFAKVAPAFVVPYAATELIAAAMQRIPQVQQYTQGRWGRLGVNVLSALLAVGLTAGMEYRRAAPGQRARILRGKLPLAVLGAGLAAVRPEVSALWEQAKSKLGNMLPGGMGAPALPVQTPAQIAPLAQVRQLAPMAIRRAGGVSPAEFSKLYARAGGMGSRGRYLGDY